jgi:hypothetical protein
MTPVCFFEYFVAAALGLIPVGGVLAGLWMAVLLLAGWLSPGRPRNPNSKP